MPDMSPSVALNRLTRSKRDAKLALVVQNALIEYQWGAQADAYAIANLSDEVQALRDRSLEIVQRLEAIADMPNGTAKNQLRRLLKELKGEPFTPEPEPVGPTVDQLIEVANRISREASL